MTRLRACCVGQSAVGWAVTPRMCTRRVAISMTKRTYSRRRVIRVKVERVGEDRNGLALIHDTPLVMR